MNYDEYQRYLQTPHWRALQAWCRQRAGNRCEGQLPILGTFRPDKDGWQTERCLETEGLQVHHRTYERLWHERPEDVVLLCDRCHVVAHLMSRHCRWCNSPVFADVMDAFALYDADSENAMASAPTCCPGCDHMLSKDD